MRVASRGHLIPLCHLVTKSGRGHSPGRGGPGQASTQLVWCSSEGPGSSVQLHPQLHRAGCTLGVAHEALRVQLWCKQRVKGCIYLLNAADSTDLRAVVRYVFYIGGLQKDFLKPNIKLVLKKEKRPCNRSILKAFSKLNRYFLFCFLVTK